MKYKEGDRVRVREDLKLRTDPYSVNITEEMVALSGQVVTIEFCHYDRYIIKGDKGLWYWTDEMFSGLADEPTKPIQLSKLESIAKDILCANLSNPEALQHFTKLVGEDDDKDAITRACDNSIRIAKIFIERLNKQ